MVNFGSFGPLFARSSLLGMGLEMIIAGLRRSKSFGLARPHTREWHLPCPMQTAARHLHPAVDHMGCACKHCCLLWTVAVLFALCHSRTPCCSPRTSRAATWNTDTEPHDGAFRTAVPLSSPDEAARSIVTAVLQQVLHDRPGSSQGPVCSGAISEPDQP